MTTPPLAQVPVRSAAELTRRWAALLDPPVFAARSLWLLWLTGDGRSLPLVVPVDDLPAVPDRLMLRGLADFHETLTEDLDVTHLAMALCRPGRAVVTAADEEWATGLHTVLDDAIGSSWSLHLAAGGRVVPVVERPTWRPSTG
ncbi:hypothetical protein [Geodermatophilus poikilotrophus]|uniref:Uncharacterized protein n=1 Tax=Geodermatophilus poikilotrophus TaxID=1333667 RepID=A0A1I0CLQ6_9ACTN|nr:hypothetical protein [Geodermatophilus poikilotrophus]SET20563.1 hypothetical protein SAMN04488546_1655 [Geodermatophilus poikilotrophus]